MESAQKCTRMHKNPLEGAGTGRAYVGLKRRRRPLLFDNRISDPAKSRVSVEQVGLETSLSGSDAPRVCESGTPAPLARGKKSDAQIGAQPAHHHTQKSASFY